jgi:predicted transposase/invertase (TIGR01784 family)
MCRINPRVDFAFKKLFGSEENKDLLLSLLNAILADEPDIIDLTLKNPYNLAAYQAGKMSILDIKAVDENGRWFNVEMQIGQYLYFDKRSIYYWAKLVTEQLSEGMLFKELKKTFSINILDFNFIQDDGEFHNVYKIINVATGKDDKLHDMFELHYIELKKFTRKHQEISTALDRWSTFLTCAHKLDKNKLPEELRNDKEIVKAVTAVDRMFDEDERLVYEGRMLVMADIEGKIDSAEDKGMAKGIEMGIEKGIEKGIERGMEKGIAKGVETGKKEEQLKNVENMLLEGMEMPLISKITGLSPEEVRRLTTP